MIATTLCKISSAAAKRVKVSSPRRGMELTMAIADWVMEATERRRQRLRDEGYDMGYEDADKGRPRGFSLDALDKSGKKRKTE